MSAVLGFKLLSQTHRVASAIVSGWQVQGIYAGQSGQALGCSHAILRDPDNWMIESLDH